MWKVFANLDYLLHGSERWKMERGCSIQDSNLVLLCPPQWWQLHLCKIVLVHCLPYIVQQMLASGPSCQLHSRTVHHHWISLLQNLWKMEKWVHILGLSFIWTDSRNRYFTGFTAFATGFD